MSESGRSDSDHVQAYPKQLIGQLASIQAVRPPSVNADNTYKERPWNLMPGFENVRLRRFFCSDTRHSCACFIQKAALSFVL